MSTSFSGAETRITSASRLLAVQVDPRRIAGAAGRHHAFDDQHVLAHGGLLIQGDDFFEQLVELAVAEHPLDMGRAQGLRRFEAVGARHQFGGAFGAGVAGVRLGNRFEEADFQPGTFKGADQPKADRGQTHTKIGGRDKKVCMRILWRCMASVALYG